MHDNLLNYISFGLLMAVFVLFLYVAIVSWLFAPWVPARKRDMERIFKLAHELKSGARVISYSFTIPGWEPAEASKPTKKDLPVYLYRR
jgi:hypothetical protein